MYTLFLIIWRIIECYGVSGFSFGFVFWAGLPCLYCASCVCLDVSLVFFFAGANCGVFFSCFMLWAQQSSSLIMAEIEWAKWYFFFRMSKVSILLVMCLMSWLIFMYECFVETTICSDSRAYWTTLPHSWIPFWFINSQLSARLISWISFRFINGLFKSLFCLCWIFQRSCT